MSCLWRIADLNRDRRLDAWMRRVAFEFEVAVLEREDIRALWIDQHLRRRVRRSRQLRTGLVEMIVVEVRVAEGVDELAGLKAGYLRHHLREQRVARDVERDTEEDVGAALVELAAQLSVSDEELEEAMARR